MDSKLKISALILAAGRGKRIGKPKWQLKHNGQSYLEIIAEKLKSAEINDIYCVIRSDSKPNLLKNIKYVINPEPDLPMFSSVYYGLKSIKSTDGILIFPVDHPFVKTETIMKITDKFKSTPKNTIRPIYEGKGGHPIIIPGETAAKVNSKEYPEGLRNFLQKNTELVNFPVNDQCILKNINSPGDL